MNYLTISIGAVPCLYGIYIFYLRVTGNDKKFGKLEPMKKFWGKRAGSIVHYIGYVIVPIVAGVIIIIFGIMGLSIVDWLNA